MCPDAKIWLCNKTLYSSIESASPRETHRAPKASTAKTPAHNGTNRRSARPIQSSPNRLKRCVATENRAFESFPIAIAAVSAVMKIRDAGQS